MTGKKILMVHKHFLPDTPPYASILHDIAEFLVKNTHEVTVYSAQPNYKAGIDRCKRAEKFSNGINVRRIRLLVTIFNASRFKFIDMFYFPLRVFIHILLNKYDVITVSTAPQVTLGWASALACKFKKVKLIYHCMDIHPEIGAISGEFSNPIIFKFLKSMDNFTLNNSHRVIVLSSDMKKSLIERGYANSGNINIINNFALSNVEGDHSDKINFNNMLKSDGVIRLLFAGNIGRFQGLEKLIYAFNTLQDNSNLELVFLGEGKALLELQNIASHPSIRFISKMPISIAKIIIKNSDFGIISLENEVIKYAYPSKAATYLEQGLPLLALVDSGTELSNMINEEKIGYTVENNNIEGIKIILKKIHSESYVNNNSMSKAASNLYINKFSKEKMLYAWSLLMEEI